MTAQFTLYIVALKTLWYTVKQNPSVCFMYFIFIRTANEWIMTTDNKKAELPQRWPHDVPYIWLLWKFSSPWVRPWDFCRNF